MTRFYIAALLILIFTACTRTPEPAAQIPTLAVLPDEASIPTVADTRPPTVTPTESLTPIPTVTALPSPTNSPTEAPTATYDPSQWIVLTQVSPFDDKVLMGVARDADSPVQTWLTRPTPTLFFRCNDGVFDIFVNIGARLENPPDLMDQVRVKLRYDQEPTIDVIMHTAGRDEDGMIFIDTQETLKAMLTHSTLAFGFTPYNANFAYTTFSLNGLRSAIEPLVTACNLNI